MPRSDRRRYRKDAADKAVSPEGGRAAWIPYRDGCREDSTEYLIDDDIMLTVRLFWDGPLLTDFIIALKLKHRSSWRRIALIDCKHGQVHKHQWRANGSVEITKIREINAPEDVRQTYDDAYSMMYARWKDNLRRWRRGR